MGVAQQAERERQALQFGNGPVHGINVVVNFFPVVAALGLQVFLAHQGLVHRRFGALDAARLRGFLHHVHLNEQVNARGQLGVGVQLAQLEGGFFQQHVQLGVVPGEGVVDGVGLKAAVAHLRLPETGFEGA